MFLLHGDSRYLDVLERVIYNGFLSGVAMTGDRFFYPNPLETDGKDKFNMGSCERAPWFGCSCCPVNDVRFIPEIASYIYATRGSDLFVNLYLSGTATAKVTGTPVEIRQDTRYPWDGKVNLAFPSFGIRFNGMIVRHSKKFTLNLRIPGWARNEPAPSDLYHYDDGLDPQIRLTVNGKPTPLNIEKGYARITRTWRRGDTVTLEMDMPARRVAAHGAVQADRDRFALERGPLVYCAEGTDNGGRVLDKVFPRKVTLQAQERADLLGGIVTVKLADEASGLALTCIPYYAWCNRGPNEMRVWFPTKPEP